MPRRTAAIAAMLYLAWTVPGCGPSAEHSKPPAAPAQDKHHDQHDDHDDHDHPHDDGSAKEPNDQASVGPQTDPTTGPVATSFDVPTKPVLPEVKLTQRDRESCRVLVGDAFPEFALSDLKGESPSADSLTGKKATVLALVQTGDLLSEEPLIFLPRLAGDYDPAAVRIAVVHVGGTAAEAQQQVADLQAGGLTHLHDPEGTLFAKVAVERLPRVYVLDPQGNIAWFDLTFSRSTKRELKRAVDYLTSQP